MDVHIQSRDDAEQLESARLLAAFDVLMVSEYTLEPGDGAGGASLPTATHPRSTSLSSRRSKVNAPNPAR